MHVILLMCSCGKACTARHRAQDGPELSATQAELVYVMENLVQRSCDVAAVLAVVMTCRVAGLASHW